MSLPVAASWGMSCSHWVRALAVAGGAVTGWNAPQSSPLGGGVGQAELAGRCPVTLSSPGKMSPPLCQWQGLWCPVMHWAKSPQLSTEGEALWPPHPRFLRAAVKRLVYLSLWVGGTYSPQPCVSGDSEPGGSYMKWPALWPSGG